MKITPPNAGFIPRVSASEGANDSDALRRAAEQFEEMFVQEMMRPLSDALFGSEKSGVPGGHVYQTLATNAVGESLASSSSFGLADLLIRQLSERAADDSVKPDDEPQ